MLRCKVYFISIHEIKMNDMQEENVKSRLEPKSSPTAKAIPHARSQEKKYYGIHVCVRSMLIIILGPIVQFNESTCIIKSNHIITYIITFIILCTSALLKASWNSSWTISRPLIISNGKPWSSLYLRGELFFLKKLWIINWSRCTIRSCMTMGNRAGADLLNE